MFMVNGNIQMTGGNMGRSKYDYTVGVKPETTVPRISRKELAKIRKVNIDDYLRETASGLLTRKQRIRKAKLKEGR